MTTTASDSEARSGEAGARSFVRSWRMDRRASIHEVLSVGAARPVGASACADVEDYVCEGGI